jgi:hypothetical protein
MLTRKDIFTGDIVKLDCPKLINTTKINNPIIGIVISVFDRLLPSGEEGNLEIEIKSKEFYFRYRPLLDEGSITVIERRNKNVKH